MTTMITTSNVNANAANENEDDDQKDRDAKRTNFTRRPSYDNAGWLSWLQRNLITDEVLCLIPVSSCFKQRDDKSCKMMTKVAFENKPVLV